MMKILVFGVYVIGDGVVYEGKVVLIVIGFGEVFMVIINLVKEFYFDKWMVIYSLLMGIG